MDDPMLSPLPWARALGLPGDDVERIVIDVRRGALPVVMVEALPGTEAAAALVALTGKLDAAAVVRPLDPAESASLDEVIADMQDDADAMAQRGDNGRADWARVYAGRLARAREMAPPLPTIERGSSLR